MRPGGSCASMPGGIGSVSARVSTNSSKQVVRMNNVKKERMYVIVIRPKTDSMKMTNEQLKERVMKKVSKEVKVKVSTVRKMRSGDLAVETANEDDLRVLKECKMIWCSKLSPPKKSVPS